MKKLASGRGNLIGQAEGFRALGVEIKRPVNVPMMQDEPLAPDALFALSQDTRDDDESEHSVDGMDDVPNGTAV
jgi:DNA recombination protein RmuC